MKARPILFSGDMVRALLDGRKTQTRRIVKPQPPETHTWRGWVIESSDRKQEGCASWGIDGSGPLARSAIYARPPGQAGDLLWVRETWSQKGRYVMPAWPEAEPEDAVWSGSKNTHYSADGEGPDSREDGSVVWRKRPSIHMPRWASRLTLRITNVRVERLQEISEEDAKAEGAPDTSRPGVQISLKRGFQNLWMRINGGDSWDANPWVWVIEFEVIHANVDTVLKKEAA